MADAIETLRGRVEALEAELRELALADDITPEQDARIPVALVELDEARSTLTDAEAREARLAEFRASTPAPADVKVTERTVVAPVNVNTRTNPFDLDELRGLAPEKRATEVRARAKAVVEEGRGGYVVSDEAAEDLTRKLTRRDAVARDIAELVVQTGSDEYRDAFEAVLRDPSSIAALTEIQARQAELHSRAAVQHAGVAGALHVPYQLDPTLILNNSGVVDPVRTLSRNVQITGTDTWVAPTTAGITAGLISESAAFTDNTPTFASTSISVYKFGAFAFGSWEAIADSGVADELGMLFADAKARNDASYLATGSGSSQPQGVVVFCSNATSKVAGTSGASYSADIAAADIYGLRQALSPRWRQNAAWMGSLDVAYKVRQLGTSNNYHAFTMDLTQGDVPTLLGKPYYENSSMETASTIISGSTDFVLIHGDFSQFVTVDRVGMTMAYIPTVTSGSKFPTGESGWAVYWRFGSGGLVQDAFRVLVI